MNARRSLVALWLVAAMAGLPLSGVSRQLNLSVEIDAGSTMIDLAKTDLGVDLLRSIGLSLRDKATEVQLDRELSSLLGYIGSQIGNDKVGYLVRVNIFADEFGNTFIPGNQLLTALGPGTDAVDVLAEQMATPHMEVMPPRGFTDASSFFWIRKKEGLLTGSTVPREFRARLLSMAAEEKRRRDFLALVEREYPDQTKAITRAEYWNEMLEHRAGLAKSERRRETIRSFSARLSELQDHANKIYRRYQELERDMVAAQQRLAVLNQVSQIVDIVKGAIEAGDMVTAEDGKTVSKDSGKVPFADGVSEFSFVKRTIEEKDHQLRVEERSLKVLSANMDDAERRLKEEYGAEGIPLPRRP